MMRTEVLRLVGGVGWMLAIALLATERGLTRRLRDAAAVSPESATLLRISSPIVRFRLSRLRKAGAVVAAGPERFYLDAGGYTRYRQARRRRALSVLAVTLPLMILLWWLASQPGNSGAPAR